MIEGISMGMVASSAAYGSYRAPSDRSGRSVSSTSEATGVSDSVSVSQTAREIYALQAVGEGSRSAGDASGSSVEARDDGAVDDGSPVPSSTEDLSSSEQKEVEHLGDRDAEVRSHEQAHAAAGGGLSGAPSYTYTLGPDGKRYATSGEVSINSSAISDDPQATILKMQTVKRAAMAPAQPSGQDRSVYGRASRTEQKAHAELRAEEAEQARESREAARGERELVEPVLDDESAPVATTEPVALAPAVNAMAPERLSD
jgi:hypothetical protein